MDIATSFLFGDSASTLIPEASVWGQQFAAAFDRAQTAVLKFFALGRLLSLASRDALWKHDQKIVHDFSSQYINRALDKKLQSSTNTSEQTRYSIIKELSDQTKDPALLHGSLLNLLLAGRDMTASLLSSLFFVLARKPEIYDRLSDEVFAVIPSSNQPPTLQDLKSMPYLKACLNESLRLHPPIPRNSRTALRDTVLPRGGGPAGDQPVFVAKGTQVGFQAYSMHRRKDVFGADADEFVPERWSRKGMRPGWAYIPFSGGPRTCLGRAFALNQAMYVVVRMVQEYRSIEATNAAEWTESLGLTCSPKTGTDLVLQTREEESA